MSLFLLVAIALAVVCIFSLLINPYIGFLFLFLFKPIIDTAYYQPLLFGLSITQIVGGMVPLIIFAHLPFRNLSRELVRLPMRGIWLLYVLNILFFSSFIAFNQNISDGVEVFLRHIHGFIGFFIIQALYREKDKFKVLLIVLIIAGLFPTIVGLYQAATGVIWRPQQAEGLIRYVGMYNDVMTIRLYELQTIIALLLFSVLYATKNPMFRPFALCYGALSVFVVFKAWTKSGIITLVWWLIVWSLYRKKTIFGVFLLVISLFFITEFGSDLLDSIGTLFRKEIGAVQGKMPITRTFEGRWVDWIPMFKEWEELSNLRQLFGSGMKATGAHNDYLQMLFHGGIFGLGIYLTLLIYTGIVILKNLFFRKNPLSVVALMMFSMYMLDTIGLVPSSYPAYQWLIWGLIGLSMRLANEKQEL